MTGGVSGLFRENRIDVIEGLGAVTGNGTVRVGSAKDGTEYTANKGVILATGSVKKPIPGTQFGGRVIGTEEAWAFESLPRSLAVVGAGASGAEIASAYARLGVEVLLFEALDRVLPTEDAEISKLAERGLKKQGMQIFTRTFVENVRDGRGSVTFTYGDQSGEVDYLVIAAGRGADVEGLGLEDAGVKVDDRGLIEVDGALRTSARGIWAIGDIVPGPALAHKASDEGIIAAEDIAGNETHPLDVRRHPARDLLHAERRVVRPHRGAGEGGRPRRRRRQSALRRRRRGHGLRRPHRPDQDRRRPQIRRAARRPHHRREGDRADPGARQRARARGRLPGGGAHGPRPPDARPRA